VTRYSLSNDGNYVEVLAFRGAPTTLDKTDAPLNFLADAPGTGVTSNGIAREFPFLPTPHEGRNRRHVDCGEAGPGANACN